VPNSSLFLHEILDFLHARPIIQGVARSKDPQKYHLQARPSKAAKNKIWYAWWWEDGKRVYRSTGQGRKQDAIEVVQSWGARDRREAAGTLRAFAGEFFVPGRCPYVAWKAEQGGIKRQTVYEHRKNLTRYILPHFGDRFLGQPTEADIEITVGSIPGLSGSTRNSILNTYRIIMVEAKRTRLIGTCRIRSSQSWWVL
jgi:hypothetical protein